MGEWGDGGRSEGVGNGGVTRNRVWSSASLIPIKSEAKWWRSSRFTFANTTKDPVAAMQAHVEMLLYKTKAETEAFPLSLT